MAKNIQLQQKALFFHLYELFVIQKKFYNINLPCHTKRIQQRQTKSQTSKN